MKTVTPPAPVDEPADPLAAELEAARAEWTAANQDRAWMDRYQPANTPPVELQYRRPQYEASVPAEQYIAALDREAKAARRIADAQAAIRAADERKRIADLRERARPLLAAVAEELPALDDAMAQEITAVLAMLARILTRASQRNAVLRMRASELDQAGIWVVPEDDGADGADRQGGLRIGGVWYQQFDPATLLEAVHEALKPVRGVVTPQNAAVRALMRAAWWRKASVPPMFAFPRPARIERMDIRDVVGPTAFERDPGTGELVPTSQLPPEPVRERPVSLWETFTGRRPM